MAGELPTNFRPNAPDSPTQITQYAASYAGVTISGQPATLTIAHTPLPDMAAENVFRDWVLRLAELSRHPNVADLLYYGVTHDKRPYLIAASSESTLESRLLDQSRGPLSASQTQQLGVAIAGALAQGAQLGVSHGVVLPSTIVPGVVPQLTGYALAAPFLAPGLRVTPFTAPEHLGSANNGEYDASPAGDIYQLAVVLYVALGGRPPWSSEEGTGLTDIGLRSRPLPDIAGVSPRLLDVLRAGTSSGPRSRPTAAQFRDALASQEPTTDGSAAAAPTTVDTATVRRGRLREAVITGAVNAGVGAAVGGGIGVATGALTGSSTSTGMTVTTKVVIATVVVASTTGVGGYVAYQHYTCGSLLGSKPAVETLNGVVRDLKDSSFRFTGQATTTGASLHFDGEVDNRVPNGRIHASGSGYSSDTIIDGSTYYFRDSATTGNTWITLRTDEEGGPPISRNPVQTAESLSSADEATKSHCDFHGTLDPKTFEYAYGKGTITDPLPFEASINPQENLKRLQITFPTPVNTKEWRLSDFGTQVSVTPPAVP